MRGIKLYLPALTLAGLAGISLPAQQSAQDARQPAIQVPSTASAPEAMNGRLRPVQAELVRSLDSRTAKPGDTVVLRTTDQATTVTGIIIPKGSKIVGQIVDAQPAANSSQNSKVTILFSRALLQKGRSVPIQSVLQSVDPAQLNPELLGGAAAVSPRNQNAATGSASGNLSANLLATSGAGAGTIVSQQGNVAVKTSGVKGVLIVANAEGKPLSSASGALLGERQNVHLEDGTHIVLAVTGAGEKGTNER